MNRNIDAPTLYVQPYFKILAQKLMNQLQPSDCQIETLAPSALTKLIKPLKGSRLFKFRKLICRHADLLLSLDAFGDCGFNLDELIRKI